MKKNDVILGLDASSASTGFSIFDNKGLAAYGIIKPDGNDWRERLVHQAPQLKEIIEKYNPTQIVMEDGVHASVVTGASVASVMPEVIYQWGQGCVPRPTGRDAWAALDGYLTNSTMRSIFESGLNASGLPWKRSTGGITVTKTK